jgi:hypothetical protein
MQTSKKDQLIQAHNGLSKGVELYAPDMHSKITQHGVIIFDDRTGHMTVNSEGGNTAKDMSDCAKSALKSANVVQFNKAQ